MSYTYRSMSLDTNNFNLGSFLGTSGSAEVCRNATAMSNLANNNFFGTDSDPLKEGFINFNNKIITPMNIVAQKLEAAQMTLEQPDIIKPITTMEDLTCVPSSMHLPILLYPPIRELLEDDRISGYGYDYTKLPKEDTYGRLISNGVIYPSDDEADEDGYLVAVEEIDVDDPELTSEQLDGIEVTRRYLAQFLTDPTTKHLDPTNPYELKG